MARAATTNQLSERNRNGIRMELGQRSSEVELFLMKIAMIILMETGMAVMGLMWIVMMMMITTASGISTIRVTTDDGWMNGAI